MTGECILVVDDHASIVDLARLYLEREGYRVESASDGARGLEKARSLKPALIILDLMLPEVDGYEVCRRVRQESDLPILMLTARDDDVDKIVGLELGADDYLTKPFNPRELLARLRALLRRPRGLAPSPEPERRYAFEGLIIDLDARLLTNAASEPVPLTSAEFELLACFVLRPRRVLSRDQLLDWTRGRTAEPFDRTIDVTISRLRKKIEAAVPGLNPITTVRNNGYLFVPAVKPLMAKPLAAKPLVAKPLA
jgi:DNA-binding response OmpR family regulator